MLYPATSSKAFDIADEEESDSYDENIDEKESHVKERKKDKDKKKNGQNKIIIHPLDDPVLELDDN